MKTTVLLFMLTSILTAQTIDNVTSSDEYFTYQTDKYGEIEVELIYKSTDALNNISDEILQKIIKTTFKTAKYGLKSRRSFIPINTIVKYKYHKKGKHRYSVILTYGGTNTYGGEVEQIITIEYNKTLRETFGSAMLRAN